MPFPSKRSAPPRSPGFGVSAERRIRPAARRLRSQRRQAAAGAQGPMKVDLLPTQADWMKVCGKDQANNKEVCYTTRDFGQGADQPPVLALAVYDVKGDEKRMLRLLLPVALMLKPGFRFSIDRAPRSRRFRDLLPERLLRGVRGERRAATNTMKKATTLNV